jgi:hypothetical protein
MASGVGNQSTDIVEEGWRRNWIEPRPRNPLHRTMLEMLIATFDQKICAVR